MTAEALAHSTREWPDGVLVDVGMVLRENRRCTPTQDGETYDDCVGVTYAPFDVQTNGFRIIATPRRIGVREVAGWAAGSCRRCHGVGYWNVTRRVKAGVAKDGTKIMKDIGYEQSCPCAERRYKETNRHILVDSQLGEWIALDGLQVTALEAAG